MANSSRRVVLAALAGNGAIALAKFAAAGISGSTAMLTEAIHSLVDTADQVLLLVGQTCGERPADATHPLGYGMEVYFWSFVVALMVFLVGVRRRASDPQSYPGDLALDQLDRAGSRRGIREHLVPDCLSGAETRGARPTHSAMGLHQGTKDPALFAVLLEDSAALIGIGTGVDRRHRFRLLPYQLGRRRSLGGRWPFAR